ncbi:hypothetical protein WICPIJ_000503 [Wickerhamomyces pijperi]|uniref:Peptidase M20 dimerisation domain-containing protein n=1 Tax=Wickerhamomyces pijperi TaxID=599730 RepID=A0A9P8QDI4_WICPI|nr:hypothetical protein WICPIJ_000503 [Wickerhamomyces pijperi]
MTNYSKLPQEDVDIAPKHKTKTTPPIIEKPNNGKSYIWIAGAVIAGALLTYQNFKGDSSLLESHHTVGDVAIPDVGPIDAAFVDSLCPVGDYLRPKAYLENKSLVESMVNSQEFRDYTIKNMEGAIRVPTETFDSNKQPSEDQSQWVQFPKFHAFLEGAFPKVHETFQVEKVNSHGLLLTLQGSNPNLKPMLFMAHQDVVPVDPQTLNLWDHPPFEGTHDDKWIYGRGASDCKNLIISYFQAFERLLHDGFKNERTFILSLGFDEEIEGMFGATALAKVLIERYGEDSFFAILDEGGASITQIDGVPFAFTPVAEKGNMAMMIELTTPGGHASLPPDHTNIGIMSKLVDLIEESPFTPILSAKNPVLNHLQCIAKYTSKFPESYKKSIFKAGVDSAANNFVINFLSKISLAKFAIRTTQAIDVIRGGVKANALPEYSKVTINHRIALESSVKETIDKIVHNVEVIAKQFGLGLYSEGKEILPKTAKGAFQLSHGRLLEPSAISPLDNDSFNILRGTLKHILGDYVYPSSKEPVVAGTLMPANTDTNKYWSLSENIYRFTYSSIVNFADAGIHTVNEKVLIDDVVRSSAFIYEYVRNLDEYSGR